MSSCSDAPHGDDGGRLIPESAARLSVWADINLLHLKHNYEWLRRQAGVPVMAMVKANAYGHGLVPVATYLQNAVGADWFGVATPEEGAALRRAGITRPILVLGGFWFGQEHDVVHYDLATTLPDPSYVPALERAAASRGRVAAVHLEVDTGIGRLGLVPDQLDAVLKALRSCRHIRLEGLMTHFAAADAPEYADFTREQIKRHQAALELVRASGWTPRYVHFANSAGLHAFLPAAAGNMVRIGGLLYGIAGDALSPAFPPPPTRPVLSLHARILGLKTVPAGTPLGYGCTFVTRRPTRVATVPLGYGDGLHRTQSNRGCALVHGRKAPIVGRVSMDVTMLDVTDIPEATLGDVATFIGAQGEAVISAEEYAAVMDTIALEATTSLTARVTRRYL
ncbi:MAG: alanine racemase [Chloracidobacterium sp.]|nr:alanine racemase [Chloracidobacterium sp.]MDW8216772.1 alanine racemase [Acidobacteriota bacterium]